LVRLRAELYDSLSRHGRKLQTFEQCLRIVVIFLMFKKIENPAACEMRSVIRFLNAKNMKPAEIHRQLCDVYGEHATLQKLRRAIQNKGRGMLRRGVVMIHDNARPHTAAETQNLITTFGWEQFDHPPYSPDFVPASEILPWWAAVPRRRGQRSSFHVVCIAGGSILQ
jgi:hypothetical protein